MTFDTSDPDQWTDHVNHELADDIVTATCPHCGRSGRVHIEQIKTHTDDHAICSNCHGEVPILK